MKFKKIAMWVLCSVLAVAMSLGLAACGGGEDGGGAKTALAAPVISLANKRISWEEVDHATGYEVFENDTSVYTGAAPFYTINKTEIGEYVYAVKALCDTGEYESSPLSNTVTYTVVPSVKPAEPVISIDDTGRITWTAVNGAVSYDIYEDNTRIDSTEDNFYVIGNNATLGVHSYTVVAVGDGEDSGHSNSVQFEVLMSVTVSVEFPEDYPVGSAVTVSVYEDGTKKGSAEVSHESDTPYGTAEFKLKTGEYVAQIDDLGSEYVANSAHINADNAKYTITVIKLTADNTIAVGKVSVTISEGEYGKKLVFTSEKGGKYSIIAEENNDYEIMLNGRSLVNTSGANIGTFSVNAGETVILYFYGEAGSYTFTLQEGEIKQYLYISPYYTAENQDQHPDVKANSLTDSCTRYLTVTQAKTYTFFVPTASLGGRTIRLTINGQIYEFSGDTPMIDIALDVGEIEVTIDIVGNSGDFGRTPALFIYPQGTER